MFGSGSASGPEKISFPAFTLLVSARARPPKFQAPGFPI